MSESLPEDLDTPSAIQAPPSTSAGPPVFTQIYPSILISEPASPSIIPSNILSSIGEVAYVWDLATDQLSWGENAADILEIRQPDQIATGKSFATLLDSENLASRFDAVSSSTERDMGTGVPYQIEYALRPHGQDQDRRLWIEDTGRWFAGHDGRPVKAHGVMRVVNERHEREQRLAYLSRFDDLTGQMNRGRLTEILGDALENALRLRNSFGFMLASVDNLSHINEAYGFDIADEVIAAVAKRLRTKMRGGDALGRYSGNKFGFVLMNCSPEDMELAAQRYVSAVRSDVVQTSAGAVAVSVTMGGVIAPRHARTVHEIMSRAQEALDTAKLRRRGTYVSYRPSVERDAQRRESVRVTDEIISALNERRLILAYQPIVCTHSRQPHHYECLMRIRRADGTLVPAGSIVPIAEKLGLIPLIDHRIQELALQDLKDNPCLSLTINVSPETAMNREWLDSLTAFLRTEPECASRLIVEITETTAIHDIEETKKFVSRVKGLGCRVAIDDFGAGYTSFRNLRALEVDMVKIDGAFVQNLAHSADDRLFVRTLLDLARHAGLSTVAEWVQDEPAAHLLTTWGCDFLQGSLVGMASEERPAPAILHAASRQKAAV